MASKAMEAEYAKLHAEFEMMPDAFRKGRRYDRMCKLYLILSGIGVK